MNLTGEVEQHRLTSLPPTADGVPAARAEQAFEEFVALHEPRVRRLAGRLLGRHDAEVDDVVQDVFLAALDRLDTFRGASSIATWLTSVTLNRCRTTRRRRWLRVRWLRSGLPSASAQFSEVDPSRNDSNAIRGETNQRVRDAVQSLTARDREVVVLFHIEGLPIGEIAVLLGAKNNAVEVRLHRARQKLKATLADLLED